MADNPSPPPNTSKVKKRKKAEQNNTSDDDADAEFIARYTKIVTDMKKAKIMFPRSLTDIRKITLKLAAQSVKPSGNLGEHMSPH